MITFRELELKYRKLWIKMSILYSTLFLLFNVNFMFAIQIYLYGVFEVTNITLTQGVLSVVFAISITLNIFLLRDIFGKHTLN